MLGGLACLPGLLLGFVVIAGVNGIVEKESLGPFLILGFVFWLLAFFVFGRRVLKDYRSGGPDSVATLVGYGMAFVAGPALSVVFAEATPGVLGWMVSLGAFPVYWYRAIRPG